MGNNKVFYIYVYIYINFSGKYIKHNLGRKEIHNLNFRHNGHFCSWPSGVICLGLDLRKRVIKRAKSFDGEPGLTVPHHESKSRSTF